MCEIIYQKWKGDKMRCQELTWKALRGFRQCRARGKLNALFHSLDEPIAYCNEHVREYDADSYVEVPQECHQTPQDEAERPLGVNRG